MEPNQCSLSMIRLWQADEITHQPKVLVASGTGTTGNSCSGAD